VEFDARPQPKGRALSVFGRLVAFGERRMVVADLAEVFDQGVMQRHQKIVPACRAVVLLRIKPARSDIGVPGQNHLAFGVDRRGRDAAHKRRRQDGSRQRRCP